MQYNVYVVSFCVTEIMCWIFSTSYRERSIRRKDSPAVFKLQWALFYENLDPGQKMQDLPEHFHILRHNKRHRKHVRRPTPGKMKGIFDTQVTTGVFSHGVLFCNNGNLIFHINWLFVLHLVPNNIVNSELMEIWGNL